MSSKRIPLDSNNYSQVIRADGRFYPGKFAGLGLVIARWIAEAHHGQLELVRSDETGSVFVASLPAADYNSKPSP